MKQLYFIIAIIASITAISIVAVITMSLAKNGSEPRPTIPEDRIELSRILAAPTTPPKEANYIIWKNNQGYTNAYNSDKDRIEFKDSDSRVVIQNAINSLFSNASNGMIYITAGLYDIDVSDAPIILKSNIAIKGAGIDVTILKGTGNAPYFKPIIKNEHWGTTNKTDKDKNIQLSNMTIEADQASSDIRHLQKQQFSNIVLGQYDNARLEHLKVTNGYWMCFTIMGENVPVPDERSTNLTMEDIIAENCGHADSTADAVETIALHSVDHVTISNITVNDSGAAFISMNKILASSGGTIENSNSHNIIISDFNFNGMADYTSTGIRISDKAENITIMNGRIANTSGMGIGVTFPGANGITISNVTLSNIGIELSKHPAFISDDSIEFSTIKVHGVNELHLSDIKIDQEDNQTNKINGIGIADSDHVNLMNIKTNVKDASGIWIATSSDISLSDLIISHFESTSKLPIFAVNLENSEGISLRNLTIRDPDGTSANGLRLYNVGVSILENVTSIRN